MAPQPEVPLVNSFCRNSKGNRPCDFSGPNAVGTEAAPCGTLQSHVETLGLWLVIFDPT